MSKSRIGRRLAQHRVLAAISAGLLVTAITVGTAQAHDQHRSNPDSSSSTDWEKTMNTEPSASPSTVSEASSAPQQERRRYQRAVKSANSRANVAGAVPCKQFDGGGSTVPLCKKNTSGTYLDVVIGQPIDDTTIKVNVALEPKMRAFLAAAQQAGYKITSDPTASYRTELMQQTFRRNSLQEKYEAELKKQQESGELSGQLTAVQAAEVLNKVATANAYKKASTHQWGLAADLICQGPGMDKGARLDKPEVASCMSWVKENAGQFGLAQFDKEIYHFSSNGK